MYVCDMSFCVYVFNNCFKLSCINAVKFTTTIERLQIIPNAEKCVDSALGTKTSNSFKRSFQFLCTFPFSIVVISD